MANGVRCPGCGLNLYLREDAGTTRCPHCNREIEFARPATAHADLARALPMPSPLHLPPRRRPCLTCGNLVLEGAWQCGICGAVQQVPYQANSIPDGGSSRGRWRIARAGLTAIYWGSVGYLLSFLLGGLVITGMYTHGIRTLNGPVMTTIVIAMALAAGCWLNVVVGQMLCIGVPSETGARGYAAGAVCCFAANAVAQVVMYLGGSPWMLLISLAAGIAQLFCQVLFIAEIADYFTYEPLSTSAWKYIKFNATALLAPIVLVAIRMFQATVQGMILGTPASAMVLPFMGCAAALLAIAQMVALPISAVWYLKLIDETRDVIDRLG